MVISSRYGRKAGFTLIELLVVIAIIAILAAILMPVFVTARKTAYKVSCMSQMRQISQAVNEYSTDRGGRLPPCVYNINTSQPGDLSWITMCRRYFKANGTSPKTWILTRCPIARSQDPMQIYREGSDYCWYWNWSISTNPGYNHFYLSPYDEFGNACPETTASAVNPSKTLFLVETKYPFRPDGEQFKDLDLSCYGYFLIEPPNPDQDPDLPAPKTKWWFGGWRVFPYGCVYPRHETVNAIWLDGHSSNLRIDAFKDNSIWDLN